ncbi:Protein kinase 2 (PK2) [Durusdinium trenchii]|uniref:Protein kinase 2 (PK2) n=1 Tax=Durusdinium trenchii TaxID=1381693 RepID=A0ABP0NE21_9DINO
MYEMLTGLPPFYTRDREKLFERIRRGELTYPSYITAIAGSIVCYSHFVKLLNNAEQIRASFVVQAFQTMGLIVRIQAQQCNKVLRLVK